MNFSPRIIFKTNRPSGRCKEFNREKQTCPQIPMGSPVFSKPTGLDPNSVIEKAVHGAHGVNCRVQGAGCRVQGAGCGVQGAGQNFT